MTAWTTVDIPSQKGRLVVITSANGGLGFGTALALAGPGAEVSGQQIDVTWPSGRGDAR